MIKKYFMNAIKRYAGVIWIILGPMAIYYLVNTALSEIEKKPVLDTKIQWSVFVIIFIPIAIGMIIFGWFALKGAYDHLPESSAEVED
jgi:predicted Na+-dependent transporter